MANLSEEQKNIVIEAAMAHYDRWSEDVAADAEMSGSDAVDSIVTFVEHVGMALTLTDAQGFPRCKECGGALTFNTDEGWRCAPDHNTGWGAANV